MKELRRRYWYEIALCTTALSLIYSPIAYTVEGPLASPQEVAPPSPSKEKEAESVASLPSEELLLAKKEELPASPKKEVYTINFNNVSIIELIRFTSKISGLNFVFEEADLQFSVTVVSEEAVSAEGMLAALSQVLRMHDLTLLEQGSNVLITKSKKINQIPKIVSADLPSARPDTTALVTRVFRIRNANVESVANIIKPMISDTALLEVSAETRQIIVTDITANVDQIAALLSSLDAPHSSLEVDAYKVKHVAPVTLIALAQQILAPFAEGKPLVLVPQMETNSVYIVSTPYLLERVLALMEDLDTPPSKNQVGYTSTPKSSFFVYRPLHLSGDDLEQELEVLAGNLAEAQLADPGFLSLLRSMKWSPISNALVFTGDPQSIQKIQTTLQMLDVPGSPTGPKGFFLYRLQYVNCEDMISQLKHLAEKLSSSPQNQLLVTAIGHLQCVQASNSLLISGAAATVEQVKAMVAEFDTKEQADLFAGHGAFFVYKPKYLSSKEIQDALEALTDETKGLGLHDAQLVHAIRAARYVEQTDSLIFSGPQKVLDKIQQLLTTIDTSASADKMADLGNVTFLLYKMQFVTGEDLIASLKNFAQQLDQSKVVDKELVGVINSVRWIKDNNSLLFVGSKGTLERLDTLIKTFDTPGLGKEGMEALGRSASHFIIYDPHYLSGEELISILQEFMRNLQQSGVADSALYDVIHNLKWVEKTSSLLISGDPKAIERVQQLLAKFDVPGQGATTSTIEAIDNTSFLVYKLQYHPGNDIQDALKQVATSLDKTSFPHELVDTINSLQWIQVTNSLLCTGHQDVLMRLKDLIQNLDMPLRQVFIEVLIIETTLTNQQEFGLAWGGQVKYLDKTVLQSGNFPPIPTSGTSPVITYKNNLQAINGTMPPNNTSIPFNTGFDLGVIGDVIMHKGKSFISLGSLVNALQQDTDSTVILNPKLIAQDNRQSSIFVGQNIPYAGSLVTNTQGQTTVQNSNLEYRDVGVSLTITPLLGEGDVVTLDILQDLSELAAGTNVQNLNAQVQGIQTNHSHMETRVHVPSNHFVALTGMINDVKTHNKVGIPCLGGLPVVGALFSQNIRAAKKANIVVFIRPQIITNYREYQAITEHQEWEFKDSARLPILKEEFDEGIDHVKLPENELSEPK